MKNPFQKFDPSYMKKSRYAIFTAVAVVVILYALYQLIPWFGMVGELLSAVLKPLLIGCVLAYLLAPVSHFFEYKVLKADGTKKWTKSAAVFMTIAVVVLTIIAIMAVLAWTATKQITQIDIESITNVYTGIMESFGDFSKDIEAYLAEQNISISSITSVITSNLKTMMSGAAGTVSTLFFGIIFAIYFMIDGANISAYWKNAAKSLLPADSIKTLKELGAEADTCFSGYIRGQALDALIVGVLTSVIFLLIGMPYAAVIGLVTGFGNLIPYVGPILGFGTVALVNLVSFNPTMLVIGIGTLLVIMFIDGNIINPKLLANTVHVHPLLVVAALLAGGALGGVMGMLLAVPLGAFAKMQFDKFITHQKNTENAG